MNSRNVRRVFQEWAKQVQDHENKKAGFLNANEYQDRDQELFSLVLQNASYPDLKLFPLSLEWTCPGVRDSHALWAEGTKLRGIFTHLTENPCKSLHTHLRTLRSAEFGNFKYFNWLAQLEAINEMGVPLTDITHCGGARRFDELSR